MPRIKDFEQLTPLELCTLMCDGNPGAATVCGMVLKETPTIDPQNALGGMGVIMGFDTLGLYGSDIWVLYKDVCHQNIIYLIAVMRSINLGKKTRGWLNNHVREQKPVDCEAILQDIMAHLSEFNRKQVAA